MNENINTKKVILYSFVLLVIIIGIDLFWTPSIKWRINAAEELIQKIKISQNIAPQRLFINVWRTVKNEYADETLNNQDWKRWKQRYFKNIKTAEDAYIAINSMLASLNDPYTKFLKSSAYSKHKVIIDSKITGTGLLFDKAGDKIVVNHILDNSPASQAGIAAGDTIININGMDVSDSDINALIDFVENEKTDKITVTLKRGNTLIKKELKKEEIYIKTMDYRIISGNIAVITPANLMGEKAIEDFKDIILKTNDTTGLIMDLRNNYGGILSNAIQMADFMQDNKHVTDIETRFKKKYQIYADGNKIFKDKPVIILINKHTASAAEIFAGILKNNTSAVLAGENSYGKNSIQEIIPFYNKTGLIITTGKYIFPNGEDIHKKGLTPDYIVSKTPQKDEPMQKAIELIINPVEK